MLRLFLLSHSLTHWFVQLSHFFSIRTSSWCRWNSNKFLLILSLRSDVTNESSKFCCASSKKSVTKPLDHYFDYRSPFLALFPLFSPWNIENFRKLWEKIYCKIHSHNTKLFADANLRIPMNVHIRIWLDMKRAWSSDKWRWTKPQLNSHLTRLVRIYYTISLSVRKERRKFHYRTTHDR